MAQAGMGRALLAGPLLPLLRSTGRGPRPTWGNGKDIPTHWMPNTQAHPMWAPGASWSVRRAPPLRIPGCDLCSWPPAVAWALESESRAVWLPHTHEECFTKGGTAGQACGRGPRCSGLPEAPGSVIQAPMYILSSARGHRISLCLGASILEIPCVRGETGQDTMTKCLSCDKARQCRWNALHTVHAARSMTICKRAQEQTAHTQHSGLWVPMPGAQPAGAGQCVG